jgi:hypothetical protein
MGAARLDGRGCVLVLPAADNDDEHRGEGIAHATVRGGGRMISRNASRDRRVTANM